MRCVGRLRESPGVLGRHSTRGPIVGFLMYLWKLGKGKRRVGAGGRKRVDNGIFSMLIANLWCCGSEQLVGAVHHRP